MPDDPVVVLVGTLDTKGHELEYMRERVRDAGAEVVLVDVGVLGEPQVRADVSREEVAEAAGADHGALVAEADRGRAVEVMGRGAGAVLGRLFEEGRLQGAAAVGGSGNSSIAAAAIRDLPVGVPKLIVSTLASGDTRPYVGAKDVTMMYSVVDIAGINQISARILANAAGAIAGMAKASAPAAREARPLVGATMFGVTTPAVTRARERLEELGYEVLVFHATGTGGQSMEALVRRAASLPGCSTSRRPSWPTSSSAASSPRARTGSRRRVRPACPRWSRSERSTWSTSGPRTRCPSASPNATYTSTTRRSRSCAPPRRRTPSSEGGSPRSSTGPARPRSSSCRWAAYRPSTSTASPSMTPRPTRRSSTPCASTSTASAWRRRRLDTDVNDPAFATAMADRLHELIQKAR